MVYKMFDILFWQVLCAALLIFSVAVGYYVVKFGFIILRIQDTVENALDVMDERYARISEILSIPIYSDSPEIKRVVEDISQSRDAILKIAGEFASIDEAEATLEDPE